MIRGAFVCVIDVDECKDKLACQCPECKCKNTWGSYECSCNGDSIYMKEHDACIGAFFNSVLFYSWLFELQSTTTIFLSIRYDFNLASCLQVSLKTTFENAVKENLFANYFLLLVSLFGYD